MTLLGDKEVVYLVLTNGDVSTSILSCHFNRKLAENARDEHKARFGKSFPNMDVWVSATWVQH